MRVRGSFWRIGLWTIFSTIFSTICVDRLGRRRAAPCSAIALLGRRQRLADLAVVAVDRHGLQAELPAELVQRLDVFDAAPPRAC